ncbi:MAG: hypothetical protein IJY78_02985 [Bacteroidaceae bacterium]|nr:hypothetical protein [Bacteroidaceae bacterium]
MDETRNQNIESVKLHYVTHEPSFWQKLFQVYWVNPKSWLLKELIVDDGNITISLLNGNTLSAPIEECSFKFQIDKYDRMEIYVKHENRKIHFKEMPGMLEDEEWDDIKAFIKDSCNAKTTTLGKITKVMEKTKEILEQ